MALQEEGDKMNQLNNAQRMIDVGNMLLARDQLGDSEIHVIKLSVLELTEEVNRLQGELGKLLHLHREAKTNERDNT